MLKSEIIDRIMKIASNEFDTKAEAWQDITGAMQANDIDDIEILKTTLDELNERKLLVPLLLAAFQEGIFDWALVDSIAGNYCWWIMPKLLNKMNKNKLVDLLEFYGGNL